LIDEDHMPGMKDAEFIAAANPETVLQLIELARKASGSDGTAAAGAEGLPMSDAVRRLTERLKWMLDADQFSNVEQMLRAIADSSACTNSGDQSAPVSRSLICGACGEDRLKKPCSIPRDCSMIAVVHNAPEKIKGFSLGGGLWARHEPRTDCSSGWLLCDETDRLIRAMDRHECNLIDATFVAAENHSAATGSELATTQPPALTGQAAGAVCQPLAEALMHIEALVGFAYEHGFHELGYNPVEVIRAAVAQQAGAHAGHKLVPIEPTPEMSQAGHDTPGAHMYNASYRAMVAAAPSPSAEKDAPQNKRGMVRAGWFIYEVNAWVATSSDDPRATVLYRYPDDAKTQEAK
jgi:hypothetical protein